MRVASLVASLIRTFLMRLPRPFPSALLVPAFALVTTLGLDGQERPIVVIDAGHGGDEAGVVEGELVEKDLVLRLAFTTAAAFVAEGFDVRLTRTGDYAVPWDERRGRAEEAGASLLVMLHMIRSDDAHRHGAEIYFSPQVTASSTAADAFAAALEDEGMPVLLEPRPPAFLASPTVPTVMIEVGFLTNPVERRFLASYDYHQTLARTFVRAARAFLAAGSP